MSRQTKLYLAAFAAIVSGALIISHLTRASLNPHEVQPNFLSGYDIAALKPQQARERVWKDIPFQKVYSVENLGQPEGVREGRDGTLFVLDWADMRIKKYSEGGEFTGALGNGLGTKPGEFVHPTDLSVTEDGQVWVCDPDGPITAFNPDGSVLKTISPRNRIIRIAHGGGDNFITLPVPTGDHLFAQYADSGELLRTFGRFIENQSENGISLMGWLSEDDSGGFFYAALNVGLIGSYKMNGEPRFLVETIDPLPLPKVQVSSKGSKKVTDKLKVSALSLSVSGDEVYVLSDVKAGEDKRRVIDVYGSRDGSYLYSTRVPAACRRLYVKGEHLYTVGDTSVTKWRWPKREYSS
jgi:hypothetical protein